MYHFISFPSEFPFSPFQFLFGKRNSCAMRMLRRPIYIYIFYCNWYLKPTGQRPFWLKQLQCILSWWPIRRQSWVKRRPTVSVPAFLCSVYLTLYKTDITLRRKTRQQRPQPGCGVQRFQWKQGFGWGQCSVWWAHKTWCRWFLLQGQLLPVQRECYAS